MIEVLLILSPVLMTILGIILRVYGVDYYVKRQQKRRKEKKREEQ